MEVNPLPGDEFVFANGVRSSLKVENLQGDSLNPLVFRNGSGQMILNNPGGYYGLAFSGCRYIHVNGRGTPGIPYGIRITGLATGAGLSFDQFSSNAEVEGVEIDHVGAIGIMAKTDPTCGNLSAYSNFIFYELNIHHNYIHHVGTEGLYIGNTGYRDGAGITLTCSGVKTTLLPHKMVGVSISNNLLDSTGWDAIQVSMANPCAVFSNLIRNDSYADEPSQMGGITIGQPTLASVYGNYIQKSTGVAIASFGTGTRIYNNLILEPGLSPKARGYYDNGVLKGTSFLYGIYCSDKVCKDTTVARLPYEVFHNTIVIRKTYRMASPYNTFAPQGINLNGLAYIQGSVVGNNLIAIDTSSDQASPIINGVYSSNSVPGYSTLTNPSFISLNSRSVYALNFYSNEFALSGFRDIANGDFHLIENAPSVDLAVPSLVQQRNWLQTDMEGRGRPLGTSPDFGAFESAAELDYGNELYVLAYPNPLRASSGLIEQNFEIAHTNPTGVSQVELRLLTLDSNPQWVATRFIFLPDLYSDGNKIRLTSSWDGSLILPGLYVVQVYADGIYSGSCRVMISY